MAFCGANTQTGCPCKAKVAGEGMRCHWHQPVEGDSNCSVCMECMTEHNSRELECGHRFHKKCLNKWKLEGNRTCPLCREDFDVPMFNVKVTITPNTDEYREAEFDASGSASNIFDALGLYEPNYRELATQMTLEADDLNTLRSVLERVGISLDNTDLDALITRDTEG